MRGLLVGICAALALSGCGSGSDSGSTASAPAGTSGAASAPQPSQQKSTAGQQANAKQSEGSTAKGANKSGSSSPQKTKLVRVPPISSAPVAGSKAPAPGVKTVEGADDSVQTYGVESDESARTEAAIALQAYLNARTQGDWEAACAALAQRPKEQLGKLIQRSQAQGQSPGGCPGVMEALDKGMPQAQLREAATITEVLSFRVEGDVPGNPSYLIFKGLPGSTLYSMPMYLEAGGWKVGLGQAAELPV